MSHLSVGELTSAVIFIIPCTPEVQKESEREKKKGVDILTLSLHAHLHACPHCVDVLYALCMSSPQNSLLIANFR